MEMTQQDYDERKARVLDGTGDDEDARLVKQYEKEGFEWAGKRSEESSTSTEKSSDDTGKNPHSPAPTTESDSKPSKAAGGTARRTAGAGQSNESSTR